MSLTQGHQLLQLTNHSQTECYSNAALAVLLGNPILNSFLCAVNTDSELVTAIQELAGSVPHTVQSGYKLRSALVRAVPGAAQFAHYSREEDCHEFMVWLLDGLEREMPESHRNLFVSLFSLRTKFSSCCTSGLHNSERTEEGRILTLSVRNPESGYLYTHLTECFANYFSGEVVKVNCYGCNSSQSNQLRTVDGHDPDVLLVHLNRFDNTGRKLGHPVAFQPYLDGKSDDRRYVLTGVVLHRGESIHHGHYRTIIRCAVSNQLYLLDDAKAPVQIAQTDANLDAIYRQAFLLVFSKKDKTTNEIDKLVDLARRAGESYVSPAETPVADTDTVSPNLGGEDKEQSGADNVPTGSRKNSKRKSCNSTVGTPSVPRKQVSRGHDEPPSSQSVSDDDLPSPEYIPCNAGRREDTVEEEESGCADTEYCFTSEESDYVRLREEIFSISALPAKDRTQQQQKQLRNLKAREKKIGPGFTHLEQFLKPKNPSKARTAAERIATVSPNLGGEDKEQSGADNVPTGSRKNSKRKSCNSTVGTPSVPRKQVSRGHDEPPSSQSVSDDDLPSPEYIPCNAGRREDTVEEEESGCADTEYCFTSEESDYVRLREEIFSISALPAKDRTQQQQKQLRNLKAREKKIGPGFTHLEQFLKPKNPSKAKTAAEWKAASRARQSQEKIEAERAADRQRKATPDALAAARERMATDQARASDRSRKSKKRHHTKVESRDGLHSDEVLAGTMLVPELANSDDAIGAMDQKCDDCNALKFRKETANLCCNGGKIVLDPFPDPPSDFMKLFKPQSDEDTARSKVFKKYIRPLNNGLCLSSLRANERMFGNYTPSVIFQGQVHQYAGPLQAREGEIPVFAQLYVLDPSLEITTRFANLTVPANISQREKAVLQSILHTLQDCLKACNPYIRDFQQIINIPNDQLTEGRLVISAKARPRGEHARHYNPPICLEEVSLLTVKGRHDLVVTKRDGQLEVVSEQNQSAMSLHYVLLFPTGTKGWHPDLKQMPGSNKRLTCREFSVYHLNWRKDATNYLHYGARLFQEWVVMQWLVAENMKLNWMALNQQAVRADTYTNVQQHLATMGDALYPDDHRPQLGTKILNKSLTGSPRWYHSRYLNSMAIVRKFKKPTYFITMTCNPHWPEIANNLAPGQTAQDRPDLAARAFKLRKDQLCHDLIHGNLLGRHIAHLAVIEFQKKGLPHCHILLILADEDDLLTEEEVDQVICAELPPDPNEPGLTSEEKEQRQRMEQIVITNMIHGPCGTLKPQAQCMENGRCTKGFPKPFQAHTVIDSNSSYATYRRRDSQHGGRSIQLTRQGITFTADNSMVVPYNPFLSLRYNCHINVEKCCSEKGAKYVFKYTTKGPDRAMVSSEPQNPSRGRDEIENFKDFRCCGSCEAAYKLFKFPIACQYPAVKELPVHLKDQQPVVFEEGHEEDGLARSRTTLLTAFFDLNRKLTEEGESAGEMPMYVDVPETYCWDQKGRKWQKRVKDIGQTIGRIHTVPHTAGDVFYLRMLLNHEHCRSKVSHDDMLRLPSDEVCETYKEVCQRLGLLQDDYEWVQTLEAGSFVYSSPRLRSLYVTIIVWSAPADPKALFDHFWLDWTDDFVHAAQKKGLVLDEGQKQTMVLLDLSHLP